MNLIHFFNPVVEVNNQQLLKAQEVTLSSISYAKQSFKGEAKICINPVFFSDEISKNMDSSCFDNVNTIDRSIKDIGKNRFSKKLPILGDLLVQALKNAKSEEDFLIYTNLDISLMPFFYDFVEDKIKSGQDGFIINRRTINNFENRTLSELFSVIGEKHPGFDCFVFKAALAKKFLTKEVCIGASWAGKVFYLNMLVLCSNFCVYRDEHLTFHLGDDRVWRSASYNEYARHNGTQVAEIIDEFICLNLDKNIKKEMVRLKANILNELGTKKNNLRSKLTGCIKKLF
ncbi:hypothetical protein [Catalinimonas niigatensis]|uniref:hypothetical protein n=1 Tax=Catalinimonas niigatensis TaxID=1397264 RepID=UPI002665E27B|nr:hypothetical protein [Catalinimonas niigatensis]WPP52617.1 hypothetical protein PZB72_09515 [Catalinimonas niigatensis]